jgi:hypothetical protein
LEDRRSTCRCTRFEFLKSGAMKLISASLKSVGLRQGAFFSFPPPQQRPASGPNAVRRVGHLNAVHKGARLRHRNLGKEQKTIGLVSGVSFSFAYAAVIPFRKSVPFGTVVTNLYRSLSVSAVPLAPDGCTLATKSLWSCALS